MELCIYSTSRVSGRRYKVQEEFEDGCESKCVCDATEFVSCTPRCARDLGDLDESCKLLSHPKDQCCQIPSCSEHPSEIPLADASSKFDRECHRVELSIPPFGSPPSDAENLMYDRGEFSN